MSKKKFIGGLESILGDSSRGEEIKINKVEKETRTTIIINRNILNKIKSIAYWERMLIKEVINDCLEEMIEKYEKKNGKIRSIPDKTIKIEK